MKLRDVLKMIDKDYAPAYDKDRREIDCTKNGVWMVILCFEAEEETWIETDIYNAILVPWYDCDVYAFQPSIESFILEIWIDYKDYIIRNFENELREVKW